MKAQPSWSELASSAAVNTAIRASTCTGSGTSEPLVMLLVQITNPSTSAVATQPSGRASAAAAIAQLAGRAQLQEGGAVQ